MDLIVTILPVVTKNLPISPRLTPYNFFYRDASSALLQLVNEWLNFYLLTFPRFPLRKKEHKSYFGKNRTHDFRTTSRCADYLLDHSGDEGSYYRILLLYMSYPLNYVLHTVSSVLLCLLALHGDYTM